jgi:tyrosyl-tRNA synthetase
MTKSQKIEELLSRGVEEVFEKKHLQEALKSNKKLRIKHGIDPTGPKIHIGRAISLWKLRAFQDLGHKIVLIIGDFTAQIGDASDKEAMRVPLTAEQVESNMKDYIKQIGKIVDIKKAEIKYNSQWLGKLTAKDLLSLEMNFTAQQTIQRRNFKERWDDGKAIGLHELNYPLLQGYDSVAVKANVEIGGFDQLFNLKIGRDMQRVYKQDPQDILTTKMLYGLDGRKMSTSWGNIITIIDSPNDMFGKIMSMKDELISSYLELCTTIPLNEVKKITKQMKDNKINPRDVKARLAKEIVTTYHSKKEAEKADKEFVKIFQDKKVPSKMPLFVIVQKTYLPLDLLFNLNLVSSKNEAKRIISQGGFKINGVVENNWKDLIKITEGMILQVGKRKFVKIQTPK